MSETKYRVTAKPRGRVYMTDRGSAELRDQARHGRKEIDDLNRPEVAWRGIIFQDSHCLWRGKAHWSRSEAHTEMVEASVEGAVLAVPLPDDYPISTIS